MSRVIKFRAWLDADNEMLPPATLQEILSYAAESGLADISNTKIMQFTGLTDADGVEVFEGDIVSGRLVDKQNARLDFVGKVIYQECEFCVETELSCWPVASWHCVEVATVIGNIYEHPHLLKTGN